MTGKHAPKDREIEHDAIFCGHLLNRLQIATGEAMPQTVGIAVFLRSPKAAQSP